MSNIKRPVIKRPEVNVPNAYFPSANKGGFHSSRLSNKSMFIHEDQDDYYYDNDFYDAQIEDRDIPKDKKVMINDTQYFKDLSLAFYSEDQGDSSQSPAVKEPNSARPDYNKPESSMNIPKGGRTYLQGYRSASDKEGPYLNLSSFPRLAVMNKEFKEINSSHLPEKSLVRDPRPPVNRNMREINTYRSSNRDGSQNSSRDASLNYSASRNLDNSGSKENNNSLMFKGRTSMVKGDNKGSARLINSIRKKETTMDNSMSKSGSNSKLIPRNLKMYFPDPRAMKGANDKSKVIVPIVKNVDKFDGYVPSKPLLTPREIKKIHI